MPYRLRHRLIDSAQAPCRRSGSNSRSRTSPETGQKSDARQALCVERKFYTIGHVPAGIELPDSQGQARMIMTQLAKLGYTWTEHRVNGTSLPVLS